MKLCDRLLSAHLMGHQCIVLLLCLAVLVLSDEEEEMVVSVGVCEGTPKRTIRDKTLDGCRDELRFAGTSYGAAQYLKARQLCWLVVDVTGVKATNTKYACIRRKADVDSQVLCVEKVHVCDGGCCCCA